MWERGYEAVGIAELCAEAGAQKGSFYHWWPSKSALAEAMLDRAWIRIRATLFEPTFGGSGPFAERLDAYVELLVAGLQAGLDERRCLRGCRFGNFALELSARDPAIRARIAAVFDEMVDVVSAAISEGLASGEVPGGTEPRQAALAVIAHMEGLMVLAKAAGDPEVVRRLASDGRRLVGIDADRSSSSQRVAAAWKRSSSPAMSGP